ncbi:MAG: DUF4433 domain-containing protein [Chloroflexi bacterium]|nr:DUF4433 domain-containing protein [Chloroflexota bacterium]
MSQPPPRPKVYHITSVENLAAIVAEGRLVCDASIVARGGPAVAIGMSAIKDRRLTLPVGCHPGDHVGDYVPFYFCPRSVMLYLIHMANHPNLAFKGGQGSIVHLEADLHDSVAWANQSGRRWAFSLSNAGAQYTQFRSNINQLAEIDWVSVRATDWRAAEVKEAKQAEFLVQAEFPWMLVQRVGVLTPGVQAQALAALGSPSQRPPVEVLPRWYY